MIPADTRILPLIPRNDMRSERDALVQLLRGQRLLDLGDAGYDPYNHVGHRAEIMREIKS